jgi:potassium voltage-gated channel Shaw-related subfamily C protein 1
MSLSRKDREYLTAPHPLLTKIELVCNIFFGVEFLLRFLSSPDKRKFIKNFYNFYEFLAIMPVFWPAETLDNKNTLGAKVHNYIEVFYILRILRIFTLAPKYSGLRVLLLTIKSSIGELVLYMLMLLMTIMIFASFIFYAEQIFEIDDNKFESILIGLWWAIVTMTTLGTSLIKLNYSAN